MSKKIDDSELQTLTLSPTNTNDDECSPFINLGSDEASFPISPPPSYSTVTTSSTVQKEEKKKSDRLIHIPMNNIKVAPSMRVATPPGSARITYTNERPNERKIDLSKISRERPTPSNTLSQKKDTHQLDPRTPGVDDTHRLSPNIALRPRSLRRDQSGERDEMRPSQSQTPMGRDGSIFSPASGVSNSMSCWREVGGPVFQASVSRGNGSPRAWLGKPVGRTGQRGRPGLEPRQMERPTQHHTFLADVADVRQIEQGLLQLMEDFQAGNLRAFGKDSRLRQMEAIREQQERLAKLHFEVGAEQDLYPPLSEEGLRTSHDNMRTLMEKLAQLSESIERLHTNTSGDRKTSSTERKTSATPMNAGQGGNRGNDYTAHHNYNNTAHLVNEQRTNDSTSTPSRNSATPVQPQPTSSANLTSTPLHQPSPGNSRPQGQPRTRNTPVHHVGIVKNGMVPES